MYVTRVPNRTSPPAVLLRESFRVGDAVKSRTLANLSHWPDAKIEALRAVLKDELLRPAAGGFAILRSPPHGHVAAVLGTARKLGLDRLLPQRPARLMKLLLAMIVGRVIAPAAKLSTARQLSAASAAHSLGEVLDLGAVDADELYGALDLLGAAQPRIEAALAGRHLRDGCLVLYDLTSSYLEGRKCELARHGYSRDHRRDKLQIEFGLLCAADGCPVAVEVFEGNVGDPSTLAPQVAKLKQRFKLDRVVVVGDRGMITAARLAADLKPAGLDWVTALRAPQIQALATEDGPLQLSLFDQRDMAEITAPQDFPGERLVVCRNPDLAQERARKRLDLLAATESDLARIQAAVRRSKKPLKGQAAIALKVGAVLGRRKMAKHFCFTITDRSFDFERDADAVAREAALDGIYVLRTSVPATHLEAGAVVLAYKSLAQVERAFRSIKTVDLEVRPIHHRRAGRVRAHVFLCMLAYHVIWHMRRALAPMLFDDHDRPAAAAARPSPVAAAKVSPAARQKAGDKHTDDGTPVHSFRSLLGDLATLARNTVRFHDGPHTILLTNPTPLQQRAFDLLGITRLV
jgi:hypothetical protein